MTKPLTAVELELVDRLERRAEFLRERADNLRALVILNSGASADFPVAFANRYYAEASKLDGEAFALLGEAHDLRRRQDADRREQLAQETTRAMSTDDLLDLLTEAAATGDEAQVALCRQALAGDEDAVNACRDAVEAARAMRGTNE